MFDQRVELSNINKKTLVIGLFASSEDCNR